MTIPVLLLDAGWRVDRIVGVEDACELILDDKAVPASDDIARVMRSQSLTIEVPSVIARVGSVRGAGKRGVACSPRNVRLRDEHVCQFVIDGVPCDRRGDSADHITPRSLSGPSGWLNLVAACKHHNGIKASTPLSEMTRRYGWTLRREPFVPTPAAIIVARAGRIRPSWEPFLATC